MKLVYVAGPYRAPTEWEVKGNIADAEAAAANLWTHGFAVVCPHLNTAFFGGLVPDETFLAGDLVILERCDAVFTTPRWRTSKGAQGEVARARERGIPVFESVPQLIRWRDEQARRTTGG